MVDFNDLILYSDFIYPKIIQNFASAKTVSNRTIGELAALASKYEFSGNIWQCYLTFELIMNQNPFSNSIQTDLPEKDSLYYFALSDMKYLQELFNMDLSTIFRDDQKGLLKEIESFNRKPNFSEFSEKTSKSLLKLKDELSNAKSHTNFLDILCEYYLKYGSGDLSLSDAFRVKSDDDDKIVLIPIVNAQESRFDDLIGYEMQKTELIQNTQKFIDGTGFNNVLLFGESGTGKSTSIRAILNKFSDEKVKMIEIYKNQIHLLNDIIGEIKNKPYKFILYMDDLSFEDYETDYKYLKAIIEGGLETRPQNIVLYATSNRRHLIKEQWGDRIDSMDGEVHYADSVQEKLSLAARFGITIYFPSPNNAEFKNIVIALAEQNNIQMPHDKLIKEAKKWEMRHGGLSGRTAQQFVTYLKK